MKALVFLCLFVLCGAALMGRLSGDLDSVREQKHQLEAQLQIMRQDLEQSRTKETDLSQSLAQALTERDQAVTNIRNLEQVLAATQQEYDRAVDAISELEKRLAAAEHERDQILNTLQMLRQSPEAIRQERDAALARNQTLEAQLSKFQRDRSVAQATYQSRPAEPSPSFVPDSLRMMFALAGAVTVLSLSGWRYLHSQQHGRSRSSSATQGRVDNTTILVALPREWVSLYAQWVRRMSSVSADQAAKYDE